ncbi:GntR family transcriptional regulator [Paenibacillus eucommiae]|uniref:DNA-binding GntR family transcriptional regulator n=1 Tax=Paenibacillus eucommiae TaxID=1355755 RepID=A0ABS4J6I3_9BACL|nr:GntR family transcriptional regulator [Paenibacillus eucommiae]MBP1995398.1 DNA-binding GntR family transcriptional regulator [Paenibacillus eucommiae]
METKPIKNVESEANSKSDQVYEYIKEKIINNLLKPGQKIVIREIAKQLGVSDIPVREALKTLASESLVEFKTNSGAKVATFDIKALEQIFLVRTELETLASRLAVSVITEEEVAELEQLIELMNECYAEDEVFKFGIYNRKFHNILYRACRMPVLIEIIDNLYARSSRSQGVFNTDRDRLRHSNEEHIEIVQALKERDEAKVAQIIREQKEKGFKKVLQTLRDMIAFF